MDRDDKHRERKPVAFDEVVKRLLNTPPASTRKPRAKRAKRKRLFAQGKADADSVRQATARAATLHGDLRNTHLQYHIAMRSLLTPEQVAVYARQRGYVPK